MYALNFSIFLKIMQQFLIKKYYWYYFLFPWIETLILIYNDKFGNDKIQDKSNWTERVISKIIPVFNDEIIFLLLFLCMCFGQDVSLLRISLGELRLPSQVEAKCRIPVSSIIHDTLWFPCRELTSSLGGGRADSIGSCRSAAVWWKISIGAAASWKKVCRIGCRLPLPQACWMNDNAQHPFKWAFPFPSGYLACIWFPETFCAAEIGTAS